MLDPVYIDVNFLISRVPGLTPVPSTERDDTSSVTPQPPATTNSSSVPRELSMILKELKVVMDKIREDEEAATVVGDWKFAAMVLDRLCLITFTVFTIIATLAVLAAAPNVIVK